LGAEQLRRYAVGLNSPGFQPFDGEQGEVPQRLDTLTAARRDLGHDPQYTIEQGLRRTLAWYRSQSPAGSK